MNIKKTAVEAARLSKGLSIESCNNSEYVAIWADGSVSMPDNATLSRGAGEDGWESPVVSLDSPHRISDVMDRIREESAR